MSIEVNHSIEGAADAPPLVLAGSLGTGLGMWDEQAAELAAHLRLIRYDQRGHGGSPVPHGPYSIADLGGDMIALLDAIGLERASVCGLSIGGMTALWVAANAPERVDRLVLACTTAHLPPAESWTDRADAVRGGGVEVVADAVIGRWFTPALERTRPERVAELRGGLLATPVEGYAGCCEAIAGFDLRDGLGAIEAPTLVLSADEDVAIPPEHGLRLAEAIPGARFELIRGAAHLANVEQPDSFTGALLGHLGAEVGA